MALLTRRGLLACGAAGLLVPPRLLAGTGAGERKFIFVFCPGGWDPAMVFAPLFNDAIDHAEGDVAATANGIPYTDGAARPAVRTFFETWGGSTCVLNGLEVPSLAHDVCTRLTMTGNAEQASDDWVSIIAGHSTADRILPNLQISGPIYPYKYVSASVRIGLAGQLPTLLDGTAVELASTPYPAVPADRDALEEAFVKARTDSWTSAAHSRMAKRVGAAEQLALTRSNRLLGLADDLTADNSADLYATGTVAVRALVNGLSRTAIVAYGAGANGLWDTHSNNNDQQGFYETLFTALNGMLADLAAAPGDSGGSVLDETTVVVLSEMGRTPELNSSQGKDHWAYTSAMFIGAGVSGGRTVGAWTDELSGAPMNLSSGEADEGGVTLHPGHLGATLLALADIDPGEFVPGGEDMIIEAVLG
jgi:uncharacterized protein (DUF1501 family)